ncbi:4'-phosphopantetheinyl transferase [Streptomyces sp. NPDC127106]|uniref:4'-phosphopantetheinyl transferase family protein n=1 Tax=Streptomyces sp. NPDC127106 TaxID=3345360 RepID=UPI00363757FF
MIETLVPAEASASESFGPDGSAVLYPEEAALVAGALNERREEFTTVRGCARRALAALGLPPAPVLPGKRNVPRWPAGVVGSMTHCSGYRAAVLARDTDLMAVGIDAEPHRPLPRGVLEATALPEELAWARTPSVGGAPFHRDRLLFSAKEAVYKTWFPLVGTELDFEEAVISFREDGTGGAAAETPGSGAPAAGARTGTFRARVLRPGTAPDGHPVTAFAGRWTAHRGLVVTAITVPARRPPVPAGTGGGVGGGVGHPGR